MVPPNQTFLPPYAPLSTPTSAYVLIELIDMLYSIHMRYGYIVCCHMYMNTFMISR